MKVIYIAGKYRGPNAWAVEQNIRAAEEVAARVAAMGMMPLAVHPMTRYIGGANTDEQFWLDGTIELMRRCDAVVLVPNWRDSDGSRLEVEEAWKRLIPVFGEDMPAGGTCSEDQIMAALDHLQRWLDVQAEVTP